MTTLEFACRVEAYPGGGHDRAEFWDFGAFAVVCLADGAGGMSGAGPAADLWMSTARQFARSLGRMPDEAAWCDCLREADVKIYADCDAGDTTAVVATVTAEAILGASVGDSCAWLFEDGGRRELTERQKVRPFLGTGGAVPTPFVARGWSGTLLLATDGLWRYGKMDGIARAAAQSVPPAACAALVDLVRLKSGALQDDVGVVVCRREVTPAQP